MKITAESPELTAYALGELPESERALVEQAIASDTVLQAEVHEIRRAVALLETELANENAVALSPEQRGRIIAEADVAPQNHKISRDPRPGFFATVWSLWRRHQAVFSSGLVMTAALAVAAFVWLTPKPAKNITSLPAVQQDEVWHYRANRERMAVQAGETPPANQLVPIAPSPSAVTTSSWDMSLALEGRPAAAGSVVKSLDAKAVKEQKPPVSEESKRGALIVRAPTTGLQKDDGAIVPAGSGAAGGFGGGNRANGQIVAGRGDSSGDVQLRSDLSPQPSIASPSLGKPLETVPTTRYGLVAGDLRDRSSAALSFQRSKEAPVAVDSMSVGTSRSLVESEQLVRQKNGKVEALSQMGRSYTASAASKAETPASGTTALSAAPEPLSDEYAYRRQESFYRAPEALLKERGSEKAPNVALGLEYTPGNSFGFNGPGAVPQDKAYGEERYLQRVPNPFQDVRSMPLSTFGLDVDTASYANVRRFVREGVRPPADAVRVEEMINYFPYTYAAPHDGKPFGVQVEVADCPWNQAHRLVRIAVKAREIDRAERPRANLVFLIDVSGSMEPENKLPLVKRSLHLLLEKLSERDSVGVVTYAGEAKIAMEPTAVTPEGRQRLLTSIDALRAGHGTHGSAGIQQAYAMATNHFITGGVNRVLLCTDGDFNIGITSRDELLSLITETARTGVFLSVLGYGMDNYKDSTMETLADRGNGNYAYIDSFREAQKVLSQQMEGTLVTVAKDVKAQIEFNPDRVVSWRQIGYEKRQLADRDFNDDAKDAGEIGAGHAVTILYEVVPSGDHRPGVDTLRYKSGAKADASRDGAEHADELLFIRLRYKEPEGAKSKLVEIPVKDSDVSWEKTSADFKFAAAVAGFGELLRDSANKGDLNWERVMQLGEQGLGEDREGYRAEFIDLVRGARKIIGDR